jgi:DNA (cytosine-5)-methyltransferase 1
VEFIYIAYASIGSEYSMIKVLELFGGIGACSKALERLGIDYEIADYVEIDKYAVKSFNAMHNTNFEPQDIITWDKDIEVDLIMHGSPCQDFSLAGKQAGGDKDSGTRSSLLYETIRIVSKLKPKYVIWENVKNVISQKHRHNFDEYLKEMEELGYTNYYQVLNAKDYGIPQNRERVFTVSIKNDKDKDGIEILNMFNFPKKQELKLKLKDMLEDEVDEKYYLSDSSMVRISGWKSQGRPLKKVRGLDSTIPTITARSQGDEHGQTIYISNQEEDIDIETKIISGTKEDLRIRKLTPKECWRLMGFDDEDFDKASQVNSNAQLYKQAGNSIVVNVLEEILKELLL